MAETRIFRYYVRGDTRYRRDIDSIEFIVFYRSDLTLCDPVMTQ